MSHYIYPELMPNILARLPIDDVLRCTSVCKSWYELITSHSFALSHINLSSSSQEPRLLFQYDQSNELTSFRLRRDNQAFDEIAVVDSPCSDDSYWQVVDCCNGLFCLYHKYVRGRTMLWNPSLRKSFFLSNPRDSSDMTIGFAYVPAINDYKIVRFSYASTTQAEIFQLSTGSWRDLELSTGSWRDPELENSSYADVIYPQAHLNGILHWCVIASEDLVLWICSFDMKTEKFGTLMLPSSSLRLEHCLDNPVPFTFRESLCLIDFLHYQSCNMWVLKEYGVADSWEKLFVIETKQENLTLFRNVKDDRELLFHTCDFLETNLVSYDCNTNQVKSFQFMANSTVMLSIYTYVESLVLIKGLNEVKIDEESRVDAEMNV